MSQKKLRPRKMHKLRPGTQVPLYYPPLSSFIHLTPIWMFGSKLWSPGQEKEMKREWKRTGRKFDSESVNSVLTVLNFTLRPQQISQKMSVPPFFLYTALQKFGNALEKWGFGQYWHESFLICDNFVLIRDNTNYENIFYYINSLYIEKTYIFDSSKYPPLAAITALHNLGIRAVSLFKHWLYYSKPSEGLPKDDSHWLDTSYGHHGS